MSIGTWVAIAVIGALLAWKWKVGHRSAGALDEMAVALNDGARLVDVRSPGEYAAGALPGAKNIPVDAIARRIDEIGPKDRPVILYCASGARSSFAARRLRKAGYGRVYDLGSMSNGYRLFTPEGTPRKP